MGDTVKVTMGELQEAAIKNIEDKQESPQKNPQDDQLGLDEIFSEMTTYNPVTDTMSDLKNDLLKALNEVSNRSKWVYKEKIEGRTKGIAKLKGKITLTIDVKAIGDGIIDTDYTLKTTLPYFKPEQQPKYVDSKGLLQIEDPRQKTLFELPKAKSFKVTRKD